MELEDEEEDVMAWGAPRNNFIHEGLARVIMEQWCYTSVTLTV